MRRVLALLALIALAAPALAGCLNDRHLGDRTSEAFYKVFREQMKPRPVMPEDGVTAEEAEAAVSNARMLWQRPQHGGPAAAVVPIGK
jgi:predicted anti-sigma-YlaC factor YlaD